MKVLERPVLAISHDHKSKVTEVRRELRGVVIGKVCTLPGILTKRAALEKVGGLK